MQAALADLAGHGKKAFKSAMGLREQEVECLICMENPRDVVYISAGARKCGHLACCHECAQEETNCAVCREAVQFKV